MGYDSRILEFTYNLDDLIAVGLHGCGTIEQAVCRRLHLAEEEYNRVLSAS